MAYPGDQLVAGVIVLGLRRSLIQRPAVVAWADGQIERRANPSAWLIDLSLSEQMRVLDVISLLNRVAEGVNSTDVFRAFLSLLPDLSQGEYSEFQQRAEILYTIAFDCLDGDWTNEVLREADRVADNFDWQREGYMRLTKGNVIDQFHRFIERHRDLELRQAMQPILMEMPD